MSSFLYSLLLRLLPRHRRERYGDEMAVVFALDHEATRRERGWRGVAGLWMREVAGLVRFGAGRRSPNRRRRWIMPTELRWAWRGLRARGVRAAFTAGVVAIAIAANALVFAVLDALVLHRAPFPDADRLVTFGSTDTARPEYGRSDWVPAAASEALRRHRDLFTDVKPYMSDRATFLTSPGISKFESLTNVTPGLIEMLGVAPAYGRTLGRADIRDDVHVVVIAESLARERFGAARDAVGQRLLTAGVPLHVAGVMPETFRFPNSATRIWRVFDPTGPLTRRTVAIRAVARLTPAAGDVAAVTAALAERTSTFREPWRLPPTASVDAIPLGTPERPDGTTALLTFLLIAAGCLLLTACANVASIELAGAMRRARAYGIHLALGATRASIARTALLEGALLMGAAIAAAVAMVYIAAEPISQLLPTQMTRSSANLIDVDTRGLVFMGAIAAATWLLAALPVILFASRPTLVQVLKAEDRVAATSRVGSKVRQLLTAAEVALAVALLACSVMAVRSYRAFAAVDKGFDSANVARMTVWWPEQASPDSRVMLGRLGERLQATGLVAGLSESATPPSFGAMFPNATVEVESGTTGAKAPVYQADVDAGYFSILRIAPMRGRLFANGEPLDHAIVTDDFVRRHLADGTAIGRRFRLGPKEPWRTIIGVVPRPRAAFELVPGAPAGRSVVFVPRRSPRPSEPLSADFVDTGGTTGYAQLMLRLRSRDDAESVLRAARGVDTRLSFDVAFIDDLYMDVFQSLELSSTIVGGFGVLACAIAMTGVYGVMAFLVASRRREIGIRMALGAGRADIRRWILSSSLRLVVIGSAIGLGAAALAVRGLQSVLTGASPGDVAAYGMVAISVAIIALFATWWPARQAARVDPAITLRTE